jgi:glycolate oxidase iron-sulfur subunit
MFSIPARSSTNLLTRLDYSILQQCIHCGLCLPTCPTYDATKHETSSPRGRIALMRAVADGKLPTDSPQFAEEMYFCLGCLACETACPAGVNYAGMLEQARAEVGLRGAWRLRWLFTKPSRLRAVAKLMRVKIPSSILPGRWRELYEMRPPISRQFSFDLIREVERPESVRYRVGLLTGCVQDVAYADVNRDTVDVLLANGCEVVTPRSQVCCGSVLAHNGELELARQLVQQNQDVYRDVDVIIVNSAGCGSFMKHHMPKVQDVSEFLAGIRLTAPKPLKTRVAYHDACHLVHGQKISEPPRVLLRAIPGLELVDLPEAMWCCGSAGIYNITQPEMSLALLERKMKNIAATGAAIVAAGNPGCIGQLRYGAKKFGVSVEVVHPITLLARAYRRTWEHG